MIVYLVSGLFLGHGDGELWSIRVDQGRRSLPVNEQGLVNGGHVRGHGLASASAAGEGCGGQFAFAEKKIYPSHDLNINTVGI